MINELAMEIKTLTEVGSIFNGNSINAKVKKEKYLNLEEGIPYIATKDVSYLSVLDYNNGVKIPFVEKSNFKIAAKNTILICAEGGSAGRKIGFTNQEVCFGNKLFAFTPKNGIDSKYVYYFYFSDMFQKAFKSQMTGIIGGVSMNKFKQLEIPIPSSPQQRQIVAILDQAFAAIDTAKAYAEQNLQNAKELFESYLQNIFENKGDDWEEKTLENICESISAGGDKPKELSKFKTEKYTIPIYANGEKNKGLYGFTNVAKVLEPSITISGRGTIGYSEIRNEPFTPIVRLIVLIPKKEKIDIKFLKYIVSNINFINSGSSIPQLTVPMVKGYKITYPSIKEQEKIVQKLDALSAECEKLEAIYTHKIADLEEMKKSILLKAFSGQLNTIN